SGNLSLGKAFSPGEIFVNQGPRDTNFHHVAVTKNSSNVVFYMDGVAYPGPAFSSTFTFTTGAVIGAGGETLGGSFHGIIDELAVYDHALTSNEIQSIYGARSSGKCATPTAPSILTQPVGKSATLGDNVTFNVTVAGTQPLIYQWKFNGTNI